MLKKAYLTFAQVCIIAEQRVDNYSDYMSDFRGTLRSGTADSHNHIDQRMARLDLTSVEGLGAFLSAHYLVQSLFDPMLSGHEPPGFVPELLKDLDVLGVVEPKWDHEPTDLCFHPLGYRYVVIGSQLGGRILYKDWSKATDPRVLAARHYMQANMQSQKWAALLRELKAIDLTEEDQRHVLASANRVFEVFDLAATQLGLL